MRKGVAWPHSCEAILWFHSQTADLKSDSANSSCALLGIRRNAWCILTFKLSLLLLLLKLFGIPLGSKIDCLGNNVIPKHSQHTLTYDCPTFNLACLLASPTTAYVHLGKLTVFNVSQLKEATWQG